MVKHVRPPKIRLSMNSVRFLTLFPYTSVVVIDRIFTFYVTPKGVDAIMAS